MQRSLRTALPLGPLLLLVAPTAAVHADVAVLHVDASGAGDVVRVDETGTSAPAPVPGLTGIRLLPVDVTGRTAIDALRSDVPRLREDVPGASRVLLADGAGSLYRYRREGPGGASFGFFRIGPGAEVIVLLERPGFGPAGTGDPFPGRVAIDPAGTTLLVATAFGAGGDLLEVPLDGSAAAVDRTAGVGAQRVLPGGLLLLTDWGVAATADGPLRFERLPGATAERVPLPRPRRGKAFALFLDHFGDGLEASADESTVAFVAGLSASEAWVMTAGRSGAASVVGADPSAISGAGHLPGSALGPTLALSADGSTVAWRTEGAVSGESWVAPARVPGGATPVQLTGDARFVDTLNETGMISFLVGSHLLFVVGETGDAGGVDGADVFRMEIATGTIENLSATSGDLTAPFTLKGELASEEGIWRLPQAAGTLYGRDVGDDVTLETLDWSTGATAAVLAGVDEVREVVPVGAELLLFVERSLGSRPLELQRVLAQPGATPSLLASFPRECLVDATLGRPDGTFAGVLGCLGDRYLGRVVLPPGTTETFGPPRDFGSVLASASDGSIVGTFTVLGDTVLFAWEPTGARRLLATFPGAAHVLPDA